MSDAKLRRRSPEVLAEDAKRLLRDPTFQRAIAEEERRLTFNISNAESDGSEAFEAQEREWCRELRTLCRLKRRIMQPVASQKLRDAGYKSGAPDNDNS